MLFFGKVKDGIRDSGVTGVKTCAVPIGGADFPIEFGEPVAANELDGEVRPANLLQLLLAAIGGDRLHQSGGVVGIEDFRSEERRVGKEGRSRWSPYH